MDLVIPKVTLPPETKLPEAKSNGNGPESDGTHEAYSLFEARDEAQIVDSLKGRYLESFVYRFCRVHKSVDGKLPPECHCSGAVVGLSVTGVFEAAREYRGIQVPVEKVIKKETDDLVEVMVEAVDTKTGSSRIGIACQPKSMRLRTGAIIADEFCVAKALAKAQRNAIRSLLPVSVIKAWIEAKLKGPTALPASASLPVHALPPAASVSEPAVPATPEPRVPAAPAPTVHPKPDHTNGNGDWAPSEGQIKRIYGVAFGHSVGRPRIKELLLSICGVDDPGHIPSREKLDALYKALERGGLPA